MKNYLFSTENYYDGNDEDMEDLRYEDKKIFFRIYVGNKCIMLGKVQR